MFYVLRDTVQMWVAKDQGSVAANQYMILIIFVNFILYRMNIIKKKKHSWKVAKLERSYLLKDVEFLNALKKKHTLML